MTRTTIAPDFCGQTQSHSAHTWRDPEIYGSTQIRRERQCAGITAVAPASQEPRRILMTEPYDGHLATEECPGCPHEPSRLPARSVDEKWARDHYTVVRSHGCDDPAPECVCGSPLTPHLPPEERS